MENQNIEQEVTQTVTEEKNLNLNFASQSYLKETAKWAKFLGIVGFIGAGFYLLFGLFSRLILKLLFANVGNVTGLPPMYGGMSITSLSIIYFFYGIIAAAITFIVAWYLFQFARKAKEALATSDENAMEFSHKNLNTYFKIRGILTIIMLSFLALSLLLCMVVLIAMACVQ
ncbi:MAG: DUF5362 domain-containing protein [Bacteroidales bacterium]|jgi:hypothetical protein|nr:DUF5362 domain-containing protein [Bacteroidales bacterium]